jgi:hypothetical protein
LDNFNKNVLLPYDKKKKKNYLSLSNLSQKHLNSDSSEEEAVIDHKMIPWIQQKMEEVFIIIIIIINSVETGFLCVALVVLVPVL